MSEFLHATSRRLIEAEGQRGYFSPGSAVWQIARESVLMLGGGYALLMQAAHPLVATGIVAHSSFRESPWRRLAGTMSAIYTSSTARRP
jgi:uncharacterized protein (DUF2236 family)